MEIKPKSAHDPVADLHIADAYMRWQLLAAEEVVGKQGLSTVLRENGLEKFIDNYPPEEFNFNSQITTGEYSSLSAALMTFYGRAARGMTLRIGRLGCKMAIENRARSSMWPGRLRSNCYPSVSNSSWAWKICKAAFASWENPLAKIMISPSRTGVKQSLTSQKPVQCALGNRPM